MKTGLSHGSSSARKPRNDPRRGPGPRKEAVITGTPPVQRRVLGTALRRHRENLGYGLEEAAGILECDRSKISRIETGQRGIRSLELWALLQEYGVAEDERSALAAIADPRCTRGWWRQYADVLPEAYRDYLILEAAASKILVYESHRVPELLQTAEYANAVADADTVMPSAMRDRSAKAALARQQAVLAGERPELAVVIGEAALRQDVGGAESMRAQLGHIAAVGAGHPKVTVQVLPFTAGAHAAISSGPMTVLGLTPMPGLGVVRLPYLPSGVVLDDQEDVACYYRVFLQLQALSLSPCESVGLLRAMAA